MKTGEQDCYLNACVHKESALDLCVGRAMTNHLLLLLHLQWPRGSNEKTQLVIKRMIVIPITILLFDYTCMEVREQTFLWSISAPSSFLSVAINIFIKQFIELEIL